MVCFYTIWLNQTNNLFDLAKFWFTIKNFVSFNKIVWLNQVYFFSGWGRKVFTTVD